MPAFLKPALVPSTKQGCDYEMVTNTLVKDHLPWVFDRNLPHDHLARCRRRRRINGGPFLMHSWPAGGSSEKEAHISSNDEVSV